jgi:hypothetical protein
MSKIIQFPIPRVNPASLVFPSSSSTRQTADLQAAIDRVGASGGGEVVLPPGRYVSGTLIFRTGVTLHLTAGAVLEASPDLADYPPLWPVTEHKDLLPHHFLVFANIERAGLSGPGIIDGSGPAFWQEQLTDYGWYVEKGPRPSPMIFLRDCRRLRFTDVEIRRSPGWTLSIHDCTDVRVSGISIRNSYIGPNTDGIDVVDSRDVRISDCTIECGDDGIVLKSLGGVCEDILVSNCTVRTNCRAFKLGARESYGTIRRVVFSGCSARDSTNGICLINAGGGLFEDVIYQGITLECLTSTPWVPPIHVDCHDGGRGVGRIRRVLMENICLRTDGRILCTGEKLGAVRDVRLAGLRVELPAIEIPTEEAKRARSTQFSPGNEWARGEAAFLVADNIDHLQIRDWTVRAEVPVPAHYRIFSARQCELAVDGVLSPGFAAGRSI